MKQKRHTSTLKHTKIHSNILFGHCPNKISYMENSSHKHDTVTSLIKEHNNIISYHMCHFERVEVIKQNFL